MAKKDSKTYSVSQLTLLIKRTLEENLPSRVTVTGEIGNWRRHSSGHCYFTLKDSDSVLPSVMWRSNLSKLKFEPECGMAVVAKGFIDVYPPHGKYQFMADKLEPAGVGALQLAFEQMVKKLEAEGLFKDEHKQALPPYPQRICIVTSESGAAVHDITDSIRERWPCVKLALYPAAVQGDGAAEEIAEAIRNINRENKKLKFDLLIVGRGGGSMEDLWAFNEEVLARAIFDSEIPIVSAVGHEIDTTVADFVADVRASTPTKAGMFAVPDIDEVSAELERAEKDLLNHIRWKVQLGIQRLDELGFGLCDSMKDMFNDVRSRLQSYYEKLLGIEPHRLIGKKAVELKTIASQMESSVKSILNKKQLQLAAVENRLLALNPKSVLKRGYSITTDKKTGRVIKKPQDISPGCEIVTELAGEKRIESKVTKK